MTHPNETSMPARSTAAGTVYTLAAFGLMGIGEKLGSHGVDLAALSAMLASAAAMLAAAAQFTNAVSQAIAKLRQPKPGPEPAPATPPESGA